MHNLGWCNTLKIATKLGSSRKSKELRNIELLKLFGEEVVLEFKSLREGYLIFLISSFIKVLKVGYALLGFGFKEGT